MLNFKRQKRTKSQWSQLKRMFKRIFYVLEYTVRSLLLLRFKHFWVYFIVLSSFWLSRSCKWMKLRFETFCDCVKFNFLRFSWPFGNFKKAKYPILKFKRQKPSKVSKKSVVKNVSKGLLCFTVNCAIFTSFTFHSILSVFYSFVEFRIESFEEGNKIKIWNFL